MINLNASYHFLCLHARGLESRVRRGNAVALQEQGTPCVLHKAVDYT